MENTEIWTVHDVAERAQIGRRSIYRAVRLGKLRAARVNGRGELRFTPDWVRAWLDTCASGDVQSAA